MKISVVTPTHNAKWLTETALSIKAQTLSLFEWVICLNHHEGNRGQLEKLKAQVQKIFQDVGLDIELGRKVIVKVVIDPTPSTGTEKANIGARKLLAFSQATGDVLVELDHDDKLTAGALEQIARAFEADPEVGFVYSDFIDIEQNPEKPGLLAMSPQGLPPSSDPENRRKWVANGYKFYGFEYQDVGRDLPYKYDAVAAFAPSAVSLSSIYWAPNHVRAWRASVYRDIGGHSPAYALCDDHELLCRTYLATKFHHIQEPLYLYRYTGENTSKAADEIRRITWTIHEAYLEELVLRESALRGLPVYDLDPDIGKKGWTPVGPSAPVSFDLNAPWPLQSNSVGAFRATDVLTRIKDSAHVMSEIWRCLAPGGWLLSETPSTDGRGAFQDPRSVAFWNQNSFLYYTSSGFSRFVPGASKPRFQIVSQMAGAAKTYYPTVWHQNNHVPYVRANLIALKDGYEGPGEKLI